jgi:acetate---CoA ligase (ADP-forming) subunit beta
MNIKTAIKEGRTSLSEHESKLFLSSRGIPVTKEILIYDQEEMASAIEEIGYPLVLKGCGHDILHKTEKNLVKTDIRNQEEANAAFLEIMSGMDGVGNGVLVQEMIQGRRELVAGLTRDPQFGPCVMFGIGGIFTEILEDVCFRVAPLSREDAFAMMQSIRGSKILDAVRGMPAVDMDALADILIAIGQVGIDYEQVKEIDLNPIKVPKGSPVAVDGLIVLTAEKDT